jgi:hypothetical protein
MTTYTVWSLDVWGHTHDECADYDCPCVKHGADDCSCGYEVNDRCKVGTIEVREDASDEMVLDVLDHGNYIHAHMCTVSNQSGDGLIFIDSKEDERPLLQLESE